MDEFDVIGAAIGAEAPDEIDEYAESGDYEPDADLTFADEDEAYDPDVEDALASYDSEPYAEEASELDLSDPGTFLNAVEALRAHGYEISLPEEPGDEHSAIRSAMTDGMIDALRQTGLVPSPPDPQAIAAQAQALSQQILYQQERAAVMQAAEPIFRDFETRLGGEFDRDHVIALAEQLVTAGGLNAPAASPDAPRFEQFEQAVRTAISLTYNDATPPKNELDAARRLNQRRTVLEQMAMNQKKDAGDLQSFTIDQAANILREHEAAMRQSGDDEAANVLSGLNVGEVVARADKYIPHFVEQFGPTKAAADAAILAAAYEQRERGNLPTRESDVARSWNRRANAEWEAELEARKQAHREATMDPWERQKRDALGRWLAVTNEALGRR